MNRLEKEQTVYNIFQTIAENYDSANDRISLGLQKGWKQHLIDAVFDSLKADNIKLLDICCGTGDIAISMAETAKSKGLTAEVTGLDFSSAMLDVAKKRCAEADAASPGKSIKWIEGSAMELPFENGYFDAVTVSFGLRNTPDFEAVLREMQRVLKPKAKLFVLDSFEVKKGFVYPFYKFYFGVMIPFFESKYKDEYKWLNQSTELFLSPEKLSVLMEKLGLKDVSVSKYLFGACCLLEGRKLPD